MNIEKTSSFLESMKTIGQRFPSLRFGQLMVMVANRAGESELCELESITDAMLIEAIQAIEMTGTQAKSPLVEDHASSPDRQKLLDALGDVPPPMPFGAWVEHLAALAGTTAYFIEDERLSEILSVREAYRCQKAKAPAQSGERETGTIDLHYSITIEWSEEDQVFVASIPEFGPYALTHGATYEEALRHGQEAMASLIDAYVAEGWVLPTPATFQMAEVH